MLFPKQENVAALFEQFIELDSGKQVEFQHPVPAVGDKAAAGLVQSAIQFVAPMHKTRPQ